MKKIGILGGTFDPIHNGHLKVAKEAVRKLNLDKIIFIPGGNPPHKKNTEVASSKHRFEMVRIAVKDVKYFALSSIEINKKGKSYSIETITRLLKKYKGKAELSFLLGIDAMEEILTWKRPRIVLKLCRFIVLKRAGFSFLKMQKKLSRIKIFKNKDYGILKVKSIKLSSSEIRKSVKNGADITGMVPEKVKKYIYGHKLYRQ